MSRTGKAIRECAEWLAYCLKIGWQREQLDFLEELWWRHHDDQGRLLSPTARGRDEPR